MVWVLAGPLLARIGKTGWTPRYRKKRKRIGSQKLFNAGLERVDAQSLPSRLIIAIDKGRILFGHERLHPFSEVLGQSFHGILLCNKIVNRQEFGEKWRTIDKVR